MAHISRKTSILTVRLAPEVKDALRSSALAERRSLANIVEIALLEYYTKHKISPPRTGYRVRAN